MAIVKCNHCHLEFDEKVMITEEENSSKIYFCCNGCQGIYHLLKNDGLDSFYDKIGNNKLAPPVQYDINFDKFDLNTFEKRYVKFTDDGYKKIDLIIEGIHCAACVWLNEKVLYQTDGIIEANINFTNYKARIIWDDSKIKLSQIIQKIQSIGYNAYAYSKSESEIKATKNKQAYFIKMMVAVFATLNIMMLGIAKYAGFFSGIDDEVLNLVHIGEFVLSTPVLFYSGSIFFKGAFYGLKNKIINMDFLVISGALISYIYSIYVMFNKNGHSYFDSATMIITFVLVGKYLEVLGKKSAVDILDKIKSQLPIEATIVKDEIKKIVSPEEICQNDIVELKSGEKASVDGIIISGNSSFDQSSISGESLPIVKTIGDKIISGTINLDGVIRYKATSDFEHSTLNNIVNIIEDSLSSKSDIENKANKISKYFSVTILSIALFSFIGWYSYNTNFENALVTAISVIVIACPCALALATPIASLIGVSYLAKKGLLFKEAKYIETFAKTTTLVVDKTGTITLGELFVVKTKFYNLSNDNLNILYSLVSSSAHPVSKAIKKYLEKKYQNLINITLDNVKQIPAIGIEANYQNKKIFGGKIIDNDSFDTTVYHFRIDDNIIASFFLEDKIKDNAKEIINYIKNQNIEIIMLSGDNKNVVSKIANSIGINKFEANMTPLDKANYINLLKDDGKIVIMVGDGINDTPALSRADIGIAMGNGADITIATSDVIILNNSLQSLKDSFAISKQTYKFIKQNLAISLVYNTITIPLAVAGFVIPLVAALSMSLSSLLVVGNSMRIKMK
jgi:Cu+-exporting ATPase